MSGYAGDQLCHESSGIRRYDCRRSRRSSHLRCCKDCAWWNEDVKPYPQDLEKAKELLAEAGYENGLDLKMYVSGEVRSRLHR